nr:spoIIIJ-associated protein [Candidatus Cloacimonadota bacterium]
MTTIDKSGFSVEEIIRKFRRENNIRDHELQYEILKRPSKGFFGLFANKVALVRFHVPESADRVRLYLETLLKKMGVSFGQIKTKTDGKTLYLTIEGVVEAGFIIGKNGSMLETLQYLVNRVFEDDKNIDRIYLDADGYRERRESQFLQKYLPQINKIKIRGKSLTLGPMSPGERRIIHRHVEQDKGLRTLTIGEGENKRIVIFSSKQKESEVRLENSCAKVKQGEKKSPKLRSPRRPRNSANPLANDNQKHNDPSEEKTYSKPKAPRNSRPRSKPKTVSGDKID